MLNDKHYPTYYSWRVNSSSQTFSAFAIPVVLILVSAMTRKIIRGKSPFRASDFYLGLDLTLAAFSSAAVNVLEMNQAGRENLAWYLVLTFIVFILQMAIHQEWGDVRPTSPGFRQLAASKSSC